MEGGVPHSRSGQEGGTHPILDGGGVSHPVLGWRIPPVQTWDRVPSPHPDLEWSTTPPPGQDWMGYPPPPSGDRAAKQALATRQAVCLVFTQDGFLVHNSCTSMSRLRLLNGYTMADIRGGEKHALTRSWPKFLYFHVVFGKIWSNGILAPPSWVGAPFLWEILDSPLIHVKSW